MAINDLSIHLLDLGNREDAHAAIVEALRRALITMPFRSQLRGSLRISSSCISAPRRTDDGRVTEEQVQPLELQ